MRRFRGSGRTTLTRCFGAVSFSAATTARKPLVMGSRSLASLRWRSRCALRWSRFWATAQPFLFEAYDLVLTRAGRQLADEAQQALAGLAITTQALPGESPSRQLYEMAEADGASLIAIGSTHRGVVGRVYPGTTAGRLLTAAPAPVAVAPCGYRERNPDLKRIVIGFDGSSEAAVALRVGVEIAECADASVELIAVPSLHETASAAAIAAGWPGEATFDDTLGQAVKRARLEVDRATARCSPDLDVSGRVVAQGDAAEVLAETSADAVASPGDQPAVVST